MRRWVPLLLGLTGCDLVFGVEPPAAQLAIDAPTGADGHGPRGIDGGVVAGDRVTIEGTDALFDVTACSPLDHQEDLVRLLVFTARTTPDANAVLYTAAPADDSGLRWTDPTSTGVVVAGDALAPHLYRYDGNYPWTDLSFTSGLAGSPRNLHVLRRPDDNLTGWTEVVALGTNSASVDEAAAATRRLISGERMVAAVSTTVDAGHALREYYRLDGRWAETADTMGMINDPARAHLDPYVTTGGSTMVFASRIEAGTAHDLFIAMRPPVPTDSAFAPATAIVGLGDPALDERHPWLSDDGTMLYFSIRDGGDRNGCYARASAIGF